MAKKLSRKELEKIYPRSMFPNDTAWEVTIEEYLKYSTCIDCPHFIDIEFSVDKALSYDGICKKSRIAIPNKLFVQCE